MPVLEGEERKTDVWADLATEIYDYLSHHVFTQADIEKIIKEFAKKRIVVAYFTVTGAK